MSRVYRFICILLICSVSLQVSAITDKAEPQATAKRPKIALVLAGGGAKGSAHIGVLEVLEQHHVPIDIITGTSIGSVVGGLYALGYTPAEIKQRMFDADFNRGYSDTIPRQELNYRDKYFSDLFNIPFSLGYSDGTLKTPTGVLQGQTMNQLIRELTGIVPSLDSFDNLATPYRAISTDLTTRETFIFDKGNIVTAMRASSSVPGALAPVKYEGRYLVDGGISNNIPIEEAKALGADIIIAVDISGKLKNTEALDSALSVAGQMSAFLTTEGTKRQLKLLNSQDILIKPKVTEMQMTDFSIMQEAYEAGLDASNLQTLRLKRLAVDTKSYDQYKAKRTAKKQTLIMTGDFIIDSFELDNHSDVHPDYITRNFKNTNEAAVNQQTLEDNVRLIYASNEFEKVDIELKQESIDGGVIKNLKLSTFEKSWGPNFLDFGFGFEEDASDQTSFNFSLGFTLYNITDYGGQWHNHIELGFERSLITELYLPITSTRKLYSRFNYEAHIDRWDTLVTNKALFSLEHNYHRTNSGLGWNISNNAIIEIGGSAEIGSIINKNLAEDVEYDSYGAYVRIGYDNLDDISFPTQGKRLTIDYYNWQEEITKGFDFARLSIEDEGERNNTQTIDINWKSAFNVGHHLFVSKLVWGKTYNKDHTSIYISRLGGFLNLSGYHLNELVGYEKALAVVSYQWDLGRSAFGFSQYPLYLGISAEAGSIIGPDENFNQDNLIQAGSIFLGTTTGIGPAVIAYGSNSNNKHSIYFYIGKNF